MTGYHEALLNCGENIKPQKVPIPALHCSILISII